jgi:superfamily II DNA/RNA helicase
VYVHRIGRTGRAGASGVAITFVDWADLARWKMINDSLDLPFEQPEETYSTSSHLYHDLGIDPAAKGTIAPSRSLASKRPGKSSTSKSAHARPATDSTRTRRRLRNGVPVERRKIATRSHDQRNSAD